VTKAIRCRGPCQGLSRSKRRRSRARIARTGMAHLKWLAMSTTGERFERAVAIMERLRAPGGCPWDREQTFDSIKPYTLEETYEVLEAIDNRDWDELPGELGDLLLQVLFYSEMAKEQGSFSIDDVLDRLSRKLVDRHPHVFGDTRADTSAEVKRNWEALKVEERKKRLGETAGEGAGAGKTAPSILAGISSSMPALLEAHKLSSRAAQVGFDWPDMEGLFAKLGEETAELRQHLQEFPAPGPRPEGRGVAGSGRQTIPEELRIRLEEEVGDLFFVLVNIARYLSLDPESALRKTNRKFRRRFQWMEQRLQESGNTPERASMDELESLWQKAKQQEKP
jgi:MazG family protein